MCDLSNGAISNDLERPLTQIAFKVRHYSMLKSQKQYKTDTVTI